LDCSTGFWAWSRSFISRLTDAPQWRAKPYLYFILGFLDIKSR
jgi:hypothetical protein